MNPLKYFLLARHYISSLNLVLLVRVTILDVLYVLLLPILPHVLAMPLQQLVFKL